MHVVMSDKWKIIGLFVLAFGVFKYLKNKKEKQSPYASSPIFDDIGADSLRVNRDMVSRNIDVFERLKDR